MAAIALSTLAPISSAQEIVPVNVEEFAQDEATTLASTTLSFEERMRQLESRMSMLESGPTPARTNCDSCPIPSRRIATNSLCHPRHYAGVEVAVLKPYTSSLSGGLFPPFGPSGTLTPEYDYEVAPRVFLGRERSSGLGYRLTYFQFDHLTDDVGAFGITSGLEVHALDIDLTSRTEFCGSDVTLLAGLRYGYLKSNLNVPQFGSIQFQSDGVGPTIGAIITRDLGRTAWDLVLGGRGSLLLTDTDMTIPFIANVKASDSTLQIWEARIAARRVRQLNSGAELVTEFGFEAQNWQSGTIAGLLSPNFALAGPTFQIGVNF
jgi:hypothetical protein